MLQESWGSSPIAPSLCPSVPALYSHFALIQFQIAAKSSSKKKEIKDELKVIFEVHDTEIPSMKINHRCLVLTYCFSAMSVEILSNGTHWLFVFFGINDLIYIDYVNTITV